ncbi:MAG: hypothetical protein J6J27_05575 [Alphaproteobacteria bacterium]|nr:hypothetical protein [Alphaproteobacteria bacterium]
MYGKTVISNQQGDNSFNFQINGDLNVEAEHIERIIDYLSKISDTSTKELSKHLTSEDILLREASFLEEYFHPSLVKILSVYLNLFLPPVTRYTPIYRERYFQPLSKLCENLSISPIDVECLVKYGCLREKTVNYFTSVDEILQRLSIVFNKAFGIDEFNNEFFEFDEKFRANGYELGSKEINRYIHKSVVYPDKYQLILKDKNEIMNLHYSDAIKSKMCKFLGKIPVSEIHQFLIEKVPYSKNLYFSWEILKKYQLTILGIFIAKRSLETLLGTQIIVEGVK